MKGPRRNLIDVGYGVSQVLPVIIELSRALRQKEVPLLLSWMRPTATGGFLWTRLADRWGCLALAQVSGARLLYSNDLTLHQDFGNRDLINRPRGKIYSTHAGGQIQDSHRRLLRRNDLCRVR